RAAPSGQGVVRADNGIYLEPEGVSGNVIGVIGMQVYALGPGGLLPRRQLRHHVIHRGLGKAAPRHHDKQQQQHSVPERPHHHQFWKDSTRHSANWNSDPELTWVMFSRYTRYGVVFWNRNVRV